ncbi:MAG: glycosyltransferase [Oscillospiraceae bacterium]
MLLTIGIIMKNEEKYLPLCLDGLKPVMEALPCQLIIVDTGSTDKSVEIAKKYTDDVRYFEWCDDFSAARNVTLQGALGEWYMFIDADEIFTKTDELINFFKSGEYKNYNSATITIRNYKDYEKTEYADFMAPRLTKILPDTKFERRIHEGLTTYNYPLKNIDCLLDHFGYVMTDDTAVSKGERNIPLLMKELEDDPDNSMTYMQIAESYKGIDVDKSIEYCNKGIEINEKNPHYSVHAIFLDKAEAYARKNDYEMVLQTIKEHDEFKKRSDVDSKVGLDIEFFYIKAMTLVLLKRHEEAIPAFREYADFFKEYSQGKYHTADIMLGAVKYDTADAFATAMLRAASCCIETRKFNSCLDFLTSVPVKEKLSDSEYMHTYIKCLIIVCQSLKNYSAIKRIYMNLDDNNKYVFCGYIGSYMSEKGAQFAKEIAKLHINSDIDRALAIYISSEEKDLSETELVSSLKELKAIMQKNPDVQALAKFAAENIKKKLDEKLSPAPTSELEALAKVVKNNIRGFIESGKIAEARMYLNQLKELCPNDNEITVLENMIENALQ